ncbi:MAG: Ldh family oxidoreductase [Halobacteriales archaeon]|nr:Ldh family oxidoreductase [Halobacteriales archaeon]
MPRIEPAVLRTFGRELFEAVGVPTAVAKPVVASLVRADLVGHSSHGIHRIPWYGGWVEDGNIDPTADPTVVTETTTTAVLDGRFTFGQIVGRRAVDVLAEKAQEHGIAAVGIRNGSHLGRIGEWAERTTDEELLFGAFAHSQGQGALVAPPGSADRRLSTHPLSFGVPTFDALSFPIVLDMATSQVANGKIKERAADGDTIPVGWTVDENGDPVTDPAAFADGAGAMRPLGGAVSGYKGYGLGVIVELFGALLGGGEAFGMESEKPWSNGAAFIAIDPTRFLPEDDIETRIASLAAYLHATERSAAVADGIGAKETDETLLPGEAEHRTAEQNRTAGIPVADGVFDGLVEFAEEHGVGDVVPKIN